MTDVYQQLWDEDQRGNGVRAVLAEEDAAVTDGFVVVHEGRGTRDHRLFPKLVIPDAKRTSYARVEQLFNNYTVPENEPEVYTEEEREEERAFLEFAVATPVFELLRDKARLEFGVPSTASHWVEELRAIWFTQFDQGAAQQDLSGFEHVFVGEGSGRKVGGYHFWYKYFLDDELDQLGGDHIDYVGPIPSSADPVTPEVTTLEFRWEAVDYATGKVATFHKRIGGFFNGCSAEGLLALGTWCLLHLRFRGQKPPLAIINGAEYELVTVPRRSNQVLRTFYPKLKRRVLESEHPPEVNNLAEHVRIVAALVNPPGGDEGLEQVTLVNPAPIPTSLSGLSLRGRNRRPYPLHETLNPGEARTIRLPRGSAQFVNKAGFIELVDANDQVLHRVEYSDADAKREGWTVVFG